MRGGGSWGRWARREHSANACTAVGCSLRCVAPLDTSACCSRLSVVGARGGAAASGAGGCRQAGTAAAARSSAPYSRTTRLRIALAAAWHSCVYSPVPSAPPPPCCAPAEKEAFEAANAVRQVHIPPVVLNPDWSLGLAEPDGSAPPLQLVAPPPRASLEQQWQEAPRQQAQQPGVQHSSSVELQQLPPLQQPSSQPGERWWFHIPAAVPPCVPSLCCSACCAGARRRA